jgi:hypothetical protein
MENSELRANCCRIVYSATQREELRYATVYFIGRDIFSDVRLELGCLSENTGRPHVGHMLHAFSGALAGMLFANAVEMLCMPGIVSDITGGSAFAIVPADALSDRRLSRDARWLYALLCGHADRTGLCRRSLRRLADEQGVSRRSLQRWLGELEEHGRIVRVDAQGKAGQFRVIRNPVDLASSRAVGIAQSDKRRARYGEYGRRGVSSRHGTCDGAVTGQVVEKVAEGDSPVARGAPEASPPPVTRLSPRTRPDSTRPVEHDGALLVGRSRTSDEREEARRRIEREREIRRIIQAVFGSRFSGAVPVGEILRERLTEQEIEDLVTGMRPLADLLPMLGCQPIENETAAVVSPWRNGDRDDDTPKCA